MDGYLRLGLLIVAAGILFYLLFESQLRRRRLKAYDLSIMRNSIQQSPDIEPSYVTVTEKPVVVREKKYVDPSPNILVITVFAKPRMHFASYDLLQAITATGMQFGEMNIFHYYSELDDKRTPLFSLASATKPGEFNLDKMGDFSCLGLTLFMDIYAVADPKVAFNLMLKTAEQLADDLDGDLYATPLKPWKAEVLQEYRRRIAQI